ncbi:MAG: penicillin-binding protein 1C [Planctomycetota bacterium]
MKRRLLRRLFWRWRYRLGLAVLAFVTICCGIFALAWFLLPFPYSTLENWPTSPLVTDRHSTPLLERVGTDDQWRIPVALSQMSPWLIQATVAVEDERFFSHCGVDPFAVVRAMGQNLRRLRVVSGASTLTMQVARMLGGRPRTLRAKVFESFRALQLESGRDKETIIEAYLNLAPYGGNLRGVEAASLAYFGQHAANLSLAEAALIAGLPQSPARLRPDRHPQAARARRATVLRRMCELGYITSEARARAAAEPIALVRRLNLSSTASHVASMAMERRPAGGVTTIDLPLQNCVLREIETHAANWPPESDAAVVVIDIERSELVVVIGSIDHLDARDGQVNGATARRSPGSTLKPFVYAAAFESGRLNAESHVYDVPIERAGWSPQNFDRSFAGVVTVTEALERSMNVPAILCAEQVGLARCLGVIEAVGIRLRADAETRAGLAAIVGATEVSLVDLTNGYATLGRGGVRQTPKLFVDEASDGARVLRADVCATIDHMLSTSRRRPNGVDRVSEPLPWFMWKTGTSAARRDAWAVGHNRRFAIGVWVGRFSSAGHVEFVGRDAAEPLLARLFHLPELRNDAGPSAPPRPLAVERPLRPPREVSNELRVLAPRDGAHFIAIDGVSVVCPLATATSGVSWFLDDRLLSTAATARLALRPGGYELRCVDAAGRSAESRFTISDGSRRK